MKILGDAIFAKNPNGSLKSRIGTMFFKTPGLVTQKGIHAMQRIAWINEINRQRAEEGKPELNDVEVAQELEQSVDLLFTEDYVLIRPDPNAMPLAFKADKILQTMVSKRKIRYLNTHAAKVRDALRARGENWRMARQPISSEEMDKQIANAKCSITCEQVYYYNEGTGTRYLTAETFSSITVLEGEAFRKQVDEIVRGMNSHNRLGQQEIDIFPPNLPNELRSAIRQLDPTDDEKTLRSKVEALQFEYRAALPSNLREEKVTNLDWRNEMCATLACRPNETAALEQELIQGISPEFYRQIEWLPGAYMEKSQLVFDSLYDEANRTQDPELFQMCDHRVRSILFNLLRLYSTVEYANVGRISHSLALRPVAGERRGNVYLLQFKEMDEAEPRVVVIRFQKWGIAEHLDEGKDLLQAIVESNNYADYILDRRLASRQLGMALPRHVSFGQLTESYHGTNQYYGTTVRAYYYMRVYIPGTASDKIPPARFSNPAFAHKFAELMGEAAAVDLIVGRAATETGENLFDANYEVIQYGQDGLPQTVKISDQTGTFVKYKESFDEIIAPYANVVTRREKFVSDYAAFAKAYVSAFERKLAEVKADYEKNPTVFDELFLHRPFDAGGSMAFRWHSVLQRLKNCNPAQVAETLKKIIQS